MDKCTENKRISFETWDFIEYVSDVGEESITDYLVWQWRKLNDKFNYLNIEKHSKQYENATSGADFELELWILTRTQSVSFVFQAKKLLKEYNSYTSKLNYKNGTNRQVDVLINYARSVKKLPFYILYAQPSESTTTKCPLSKIEKTALYMTDAFTIDKFTKDYQGRRLAKNTILLETNPFHCLFCCHLTDKGIVNYLKSYFTNNKLEDFWVENNEIPNYVEMIANNDIQIDENQFRESQLNRFRNIGVLDLRQE